MLYNRACAYARLGEKDKAAADLEEAIPASMPSDLGLKEQFLADITELKVYFTQDITAGGDLHSLWSDAVYQQRMRALAERLKGY